MNLSVTLCELIIEDVGDTVVREDKQSAVDAREDVSEMSLPLLERRGRL